MIPGDRFKLIRYTREGRKRFRGSGQSSKGEGGEHREGKKDGAIVNFLGSVSSVMIEGRRGRRCLPLREPAGCEADRER